MSSSRLRQGASAAHNAERRRRRLGRRTPLRVGPREGTPAESRKKWNPLSRSGGAMEPSGKRRLERLLPSFDAVTPICLSDPLVVCHQRPATGITSSINVGFTCTIDKNGTGLQSASSRHVIY